MKPVASLLKANKTLTALSMVNHDIKAPHGTAVPACKVLSDALRANKGLTELNMDEGRGDGFGDNTVHTPPEPRAQSIKMITDACAKRGINFISDAAQRVRH